jgi:plasmid stabilization system protein ParE
MTVVFLPPSDREFYDAIEFYELQLSGLGRVFSGEFFETLKFIQEFPNGWKKVGRHTRKCPLRRFPYLILYVVEESRIVITAVAHQHRHPSSYLDRNKLS